MSQEKVDRYKQEKVNRKQIMRKQKLMNNSVKGACGGSSGIDRMAWLYL